MSHERAWIPPPMEYTPGVCPLCTEVCPFQKLLAGQACSHALCPPCAEATRLCVPPVCTLCGADASGPWSPLATAADDDRCPPSPSLLTAARCAAETLSRVNRAAEAVALSLATPLPPPALQLQRTRYKALSAQAEEVQVAHGVLAGAVAAASAGLVVDLPRLHRLIAQALEQPDPVADSFVEVVPGTPDRLRMLRVDASKCSVRPRGVRSHNPAEAGPEPPTLLVHLRDDLGRPLADPGPQDLQVLLDGLEAEPVASGGEGEEGLLVFALPGTPGTWVHVEVRVRASAERTNVPVPGWQGRRLCTGAPFALARVREVGCVPPRVANCAASQDGRWLATTYHNNSMVHLFDLDADRLAVTFTLLSRAYGLAFCASVGRDEELGPSPSSLLLCIPSAGVLEEMGVFPSYDAPRRRAWLPGCASVAVLRNHLPRYAVASTFPSAPLLVLDHTWRVLKQVAVPLALSGVGFASPTTLALNYYGRRVSFWEWDEDALPPAQPEHVVSLVQGGSPSAGLAVTARGEVVAATACGKWVHVFSPSRSPPLPVDGAATALSSAGSFVYAVCGSRVLVYT